jgi:deoxyribodipyrimidine photolyase
VGNDPRENRHFNMLKQAKDYDPKGEFVYAQASPEQTKCQLASG